MLFVFPCETLASDRRIRTRGGCFGCCSPYHMCNYGGVMGDDGRFVWSLAGPACVVAEMLGGIGCPLRFFIYVVYGQRLGVIGARGLGALAADCFSFSCT